MEVGDEQVFVMPNTQRFVRPNVIISTTARMTVSNFLKLQEQKSKVVAYISQQNSNLSEELPELLSDVREVGARLSLLMLMFSAVIFCERMFWF